MPRGPVPWIGCAPEAAIDARTHQALIRGDRRGCTAGAARAGLCLGEGLFRVGVAARAASYRLGLRKVHRAFVPVVSVGNLSAGGTGKTPTVIALARRLIARGEQVAILARGYGAARDGELNDELRLMALEVPEALLYPGADRTASAAKAAKAGATVILLDDGFQHRRLARDVDIVLLDASEPWGFPPGRLLPRGLLREPPTAIRRASAVVLSRAEMAAQTELQLLEAQAREHGFEGPVLRMEVVPVRLEELGPEGRSERPLADLQGISALAVCGIANPSAFARTLATLGVRLSQVIDLPDHFSYRATDVEQLEEIAGRRAVDRIVTTGKDAVKLEPLLRGRESPRTWLSVAIEARLTPEDALDGLLDGIQPAPRETQESE